MGGDDPPGIRRVDRGVGAAVEHDHPRHRIRGKIVEVLDRTAIPGNDATDPYARDLIGASLDYDRAA